MDQRKKHMATSNAWKFPFSIWSNSHCSENSLVKAMYTLIRTNETPVWKGMLSERQQSLWLHSVAGESSQHGVLGLDVRLFNRFLKNH